MTFPGMAPIITGSSTGSGSILSVLTSLGLTTGLQLCLDAGDINSYASGQKWLDTSGIGTDFYRGAGSGSGSDDPTFNGTPGNLTSSEYWSFDGGDLFSLVASSNPAWVETLHKDNAKFAFAGWVYYPSPPFNLFATDGASNDVGIRYVVSSTFPDALLLFVDRTTGTTLSAHTTATFSRSAWQFFAIRVDEAANTMTFQVHATQETTTCTYSSPDTSSATDAAKIGALGDGSAKAPAGSRIASISAWQSTIPSAADLTSIYNATRTRFGL